MNSKYGRDFREMPPVPHDARLVLAKSGGEVVGFDERNLPDGTTIPGRFSILPTRSLVEGLTEEDIAAIYADPGE